MSRCSALDPPAMAIQPTSHGVTSGTASVRATRVLNCPSTRCRRHAAEPYSLLVRIDVVPDWILKVDEAPARDLERRARTRVQEVGAMRPTAETSRPLSPDDDHQLLFDQIATATERCELVGRRA